MSNESKFSEKGKKYPKRQKSHKVSEKGENIQSALFLPKRRLISNAPKFSEKGGNIERA